MKRVIFALGILICISANSQFSQTIDINTGIKNGTIKATCSTLDIGNISNFFDNNFTSFSRSANINPLVIILEFTNPIILKSSELLTTFGDGKWTLEVSNNQIDLNNKSGTNIKLFERNLVNGKKDSIAINKINCKYLKLQLLRTTGDNYVHLNEWKITSELTAHQISFKKNIYSSIFIGEELLFNIIAHDTLLKIDFPLDNTVLNWNSSNSNILAINNVGVATAKAIGSSDIIVNYGDKIIKNTINVVDDKNGPDLSVSYIKRLPEISYVNNSLNPTVEGWPSVGQNIKWRAYFNNRSSQMLNNISYSWVLNGKEIASGILNNIKPYSSNFVDFDTQWSFNRDELKFIIDTKNVINEKFENNNELLIYTNAISLNLYVEETIYKYFRNYQGSLNAGSNGFEDWAQILNLKRWNNMFSSAIYPEAKKGVIDRIRIDSIIILKDSSLPLNGGLSSNNPNRLDKTVDLQWGYSSSMLVNNNPYTDTTHKIDSNPFYYEGSLLHELGHARYLIDTYGFDVSVPQVKIKENGKLIAGSEFMPIKAWDVVHYNNNQGLMGGDYTKIDKYTAMCLNLISGRRALCGNMNAPCNIGIFLQDIPSNNLVTFKDKTGELLKGANIKVYQATNNNDWYGKNFDDTADLIFITDTLGQVNMGKNPFAKSGVIQHSYGIANGVIIVRVEYKNDVSFHFMEVTDFNIEYWNGNKLKAEYAVQVDKNFKDFDEDGIPNENDNCPLRPNPPKPIFNNTSYSFCAGDSLKISVGNTDRKYLLKWYFGSKIDTTNLTTKTFNDSIKVYVTFSDSLGCLRTSDTIKLIKFPIPIMPIISRDTANNLFVNTNRISWYKDGTALSDTAQKIKPTAAGSYTVKTTQNGCVSSLSTPYYYLVTDIINPSSDEFIKLAPNPFINQLNFDFVVKGYQRLNLEVFDMATGTKVASKQNLTPGMPIYLGQLTAGAFVIKVTSNDNKISYQFKMVKL